MLSIFLPPWVSSPVPLLDCFLRELLEVTWLPRSSFNQWRGLLHSKEWLSLDFVGKLAAVLSHPISHVLLFASRLRVLFWLKLASFNGLSHLLLSLK